jgi:adenylate cyclase
VAGPVRLGAARLVDLAGGIGADPADSSELRLQKRLTVVLSLGTLPATVAWSLIYLAAGAPLAAAIPAFYSVFTPANTAVFARARNLPAYRFSQLLVILLLPFLVGLALGGFRESSAVVIWSALCPLVALLLVDLRRTVPWIVGFLGLLVASAVADPHLPAEDLPHDLVTWFFVLNIGTVILVVFVLLRHFVGQRNFFQERSEMLLLNILPKEISEALKAGPRTIAEQFDDASVLFADVVGFTPMAAGMTPLDLVDLLNDVFQCFDTLVETYDL